MDEIDVTFMRMHGEPWVTLPVIACFYTGIALPADCAAMPRLPEVATGMVFGQSFPALLADSVTQNPAIHDGAIMIGRMNKASSFRITGWSYRLYPPDGPARAEPNRGSAFNSCLAMSGVAGVDRVYLVSVDGVLRFENGKLKKIKSET